MKNSFTGLALLLSLGLCPAWSAPPASPPQLDAMGEALADKGFYAQALDYFKSAVQTDPYDWQGYQDMGNAYLKLNQYQDALEAFQKSLQINPQNPDVKLMVDRLSQGIVPSAVSPPNPSTAPAATGPSNPSTTEPYTPPAPTNTPLPLTAPVAFPTAALPAPTATQPPVMPQPASPAAPAATPWQPQAQPAPRFFHPRRTDIAPLDESRFWVRAEGGYDFSLLSDLTASASEENSMVAANGWAGSALADNSGIGGRFELGFLIDDNDGLALGAGLIKPNNGYLNWNLLNGTPPDFENETFSAYAIPLSVDYYYFFPDSLGRFFFKGGASYYLATLSVTDNYSYLISHLGSNDQDDFAGNLTAGAFGLEVGGGREFAVNNFLGLSVYAMFRYARLGPFLGTVAKAGGTTAQYGLARFADGEVHAAPVTFIGSPGVSFANVDLSGFDAGAAIAIYP